MSELRPCPFCSSTNIKEVVRDSDAWVQCIDCGAKGGFVKLTKADVKEICRIRAAENWNRRIESQKVLETTAIHLPGGHGRLIDADALMLDFAKATWEFQDGYTFQRLLEHAPTIVPAEGGGEE